MHTSGDNVVTLEVEGELGPIEVDGGISADGQVPDAVHAVHEVLGLDRLSITAAHGATLARAPMREESNRLRSGVPASKLLG
jgi:hypothetical protein